MGASRAISRWARRLWQPVLLGRVAAFLFQLPMRKTLLHNPGYEDYRLELGRLERFSTVLNRKGGPMCSDFCFGILAGEGGQKGWLFRWICVSVFWRRLIKG